METFSLGSIILLWLLMNTWYPSTTPFHTIKSELGKICSKTSKAYGAKVDLRNGLSHLSMTCFQADERHCCHLLSWGEGKPMLPLLCILMVLPKVFSTEVFFCPRHKLVGKIQWESHTQKCRPIHTIIFPFFYSKCGKAIEVNQYMSAI